MKDLNISVVIPNYNGVHLFPETLPTVFGALSASGLEYEVIVVDDHSTDNSINYLKANFPNIILLRNDENLGFSKTINKGIFAARYKLVLLLNSDVKLTQDYLKYQLDYFDHEDTFGVNGQTVGWDDNKTQDAAKYPVWQGFKLKFSENYLPLERQGCNYSLFLSGANSLLNREKLIQLGGFNDDYSPFYVEDLDLCIRAWRMGWKCYFEPSAFCLHKTSTSISLKEKKIFIKKINNKNKLYFHRFHLTGWQLLAWQFQTIGELMVRTVLFQMWYYKSFVLYTRQIASLETKKHEFNKKALLNLSQVVEIIRTHAAAYSNKLFKS